ncbi:DoxX family protein [Gramella sp. GC03-9]|uniref:DoxX family protein n=1 Tax=Christiangramia oceanisediminis TaxID=2920386 RepID=A0A9X2KYN3_9FLAO|nr:DoxX family protein [Gramella oceanisediminis]MCP9200491.1 DoxX family protein [Gramella oceanisediminis]
MTNNIQINRRSIQLLRVLLSGIFLVAGSNHLLNTTQTVRRLEQASFKGIAYFFGEPETLVLLSGILMLIAGFLFLIGYKTRWAAIVLGLILVPITLTVQVGQINTLGPLFKNIAILGGLLFFMINDTEKSFKIK